MEIVKQWDNTQGLAITQGQLDLLAAHMDMVLDTNRVMNLTAITQPQDFMVKHIIDSLTVLPYIAQISQKKQEGSITLGDIGTGAGFPGVVLAIMLEDIQITLVDSLNKRVKFLQEVVDRLGLRNVTCIHSRGEDLAKTGATFDVCIARAVAKLDKLVKWIMPLVAPTGQLIAMKGPHVAHELEDALNELNKHQARVKAVDTVDIILPNGESAARSILVIDRE